MERTLWRSEVLNRDAPVHPITIDTTDIPVIEDISTEQINEDEVARGIKTLKNGKSGGTDNIVAELLKADFPKKGDLRDCSNWWGITLLIIASKVLGIQTKVWRKV